MPRVIQPGGGSGKMRVRYRAQEAWPRCRLEAYDGGVLGFIQLWYVDGQTIS